MRFAMQQFTFQMCQISLTKNMTFYHICYSYLSRLIKSFNPSYTAWSGYDKHETEGSVRAIWTVVCRRMSQDSSLSPAEGQCQQKAVPTLHHVVCLWVAPQHPVSSAGGWRSAGEGVKTRHRELPFHADKQHESTFVSILRRCFVLGRQNMRRMNTKGA